MKEGLVEQGIYGEQEKSHLEWSDHTAILPVFILLYHLLTLGSWFSVIFCDSFSEQKDPGGIYLLLFPMWLFSHSFLFLAILFFNISQQ